jgi:pyrroloquinoline quinone (PQQ) biosynthesis protein C
MHQCGADTSAIERFVEELQRNGDFKAAYSVSNTPIEAQKFVDFTFKIINSQKAYLQSAIFTFGREDLIPGMFISLVNDIHNNFPDSISTFKYYLERHIEVDGDHHSHLALQMTANLCEEDEQFWKEAEEATIESLQKRIDLWDGVYNQLLERKKVQLA